MNKRLRIREPEGCESLKYIAPEGGIGDIGFTANEAPFAEQIVADYNAMQQKIEDYEEGLEAIWRNNKALYCEKHNCCPSGNVSDSLYGAAVAAHALNRRNEPEPTALELLEEIHGVLSEGDLSRLDGLDEFYCKVVNFLSENSK